MVTANNFGAVVRALTNQFAPVWREKAPLCQFVQTDYKAESAAKGQQILTPFTPPLVAVDRVNAMVPTLVNGQAITTVPLTLTLDKSVGFNLSGDDLAVLMEPSPTEGFQGNSLTEALRTAAKINEALCLTTLTQNATGAVGTAGANPFAPPTTLGPILPNMALLGQLLDESNAPSEDRYMDIAPAVWAQLLTNPQLIQYLQAGDTAGFRKGAVGEINNIMVAYSQIVSRPAVGTATNYVLSAATAIGDSTLTLGTGTGTILQGDIIHIAGDACAYVAGATPSGFSAPGVLTLNVGTRQGQGGSLSSNCGYVNQVNNTGSAVTVQAIGLRMPVFQKQAITLGVRPLLLPTDGDVATFTDVVTDPVSGLSMRLSYYKGYGINQWELQWVAGAASIRPEGNKVLTGI